MVIHYWTRVGGTSPVQQFILKQVPHLRQRMLKSIELLEKEGLRLASESKVLKPLKQTKDLYELKGDYGNLKGRIVLIFLNNEAWLLDAFVKSNPEKTNLSISKSLRRRKDLII